MSYILDALRRADAERESGDVPGLHTRQYGALPGDDEPARPRALIAVVVLLSLALTGVLGWLFFRDEPPARVAPVPVAVAPPSLPVPSSASSPVPASAATTPAAPTSTASVAAARASTPPASGGAAKAAPARVAKATATPAAKEIRPPADKPASDPPSRPAAEDRIHTLAELPEAVRRELPRLTVGGASYSRDAASRMVILNGQVFHEGDRIAPGLTLQTIRLKSAVLAYKGYRYELNY